MSIVRQYRLNSTDAYIGEDSSGSGSDMTNLNVTLTTDPTYGSVAYFDGTASLDLPQASVPTSLTSNNSRTISFWMKMDTGSTSLRRWFISMLNLRYLLEFDTTYTISFQSGDDLSLNTVHAEDTWYNIVFTYDSSTNIATAYTDAQVDVAYSVVMNTGPSNFMFGDNLLNISAGNNFLGMMTDLRIYDYALDSTEVSSLFSDGPNAPPSYLSATMYTHIADVSWDSIDGASVYRLTQSENAGTDVNVLENSTELSTTLGNLTPGASYDFSLYTDLDEVTPIDTLTISTPVTSVLSVQEILTRVSNNLGTLSDLSQSALDDISVFFDDVFNTGDTVLTNLGETTYVKENEALVFQGGESILTPFTQSNGSGQTITINSEVIGYDENTNDVVSDGTTYVTGDVFIVGTYKVTVKEL